MNEVVCVYDGLTCVNEESGVYVKYCAWIVSRVQIVGPDVSSVVLDVKMWGCMRYLINLYACKIRLRCDNIRDG